ncbi:conserved hypothetical protein [Flavobacterium sp. 9R]|uniref:hypothetical protein n=1 Tax=Flavobacterium sp. 9R TaxID=2653143 RepID=UPI0012F32CE6|nr:hypothetical protein [Flavobacterium sp. 9R]VXB16588.1 conserved hypothetical protein [Flavobacterium sp. 9R]
MKIKYLVALVLCNFLSYGQESQDDLAKKLANPIASLISLPFQNNLDHGIGTLNGSRYTLNIQPVVPLKISEKMNLISRVIVPIVNQYNVSGVSNQESGLADIVMSGFFSPSTPKDGFTWGAGPVFLFPTGTDAYLTGKKWGVGPTVVGLKQSNGWTYGALINQIWSIAGSDSREDISQMFVNPFITYNWKSGAGLTGNLEWTQNWQSNTTNIWFAPMFSGLTSFGKQKVSLAIGPKFNVVAPSAIRSDFGLRGSLVFLFPK